MFSYIDRENMEIKFKVLDKQTWLAILLLLLRQRDFIHEVSDGKNQSELFWDLHQDCCGASVGSTEWPIDYIDLDNKVLGAHYAIRIAGLGLGRQRASIGQINKRGN